MTEISGNGGITIAIDRGGTFTDCIGNPGTGKLEDDIVIKLLSEDPSNYSDAPLEGIRRILSHFSGRTIPRGERLDTSKIKSIRMGTTVATNALLERKGDNIALVTTKGFRDCLTIGNQSRPNIFDLAIRKPEVLYKDVIEVDERVTLEDYAEDPEGKSTACQQHNGSSAGSEIIQGLSGEAVRMIKPLNESDVRCQLKILREKGYQSIAVCLMHAYTYPFHEKMIGLAAESLGFKQISLSHELMPMVKLVARATSTCADAYLTPTIKKYIAGFSSGFDGVLGGRDNSADRAQKQARCEFMQSDGGLVDVNKFSGLKAILSGPAGGVVGYALTSYDSQTKIPVIGFDMGGTSTDVSRYGMGRFEHVFETTTAGITIQSPQLDINTVAAGGGSKLSFRNGIFHVGPESASAHPGPACYRKGGPLTITDANLYLGRLLPDFFPKIFGETENEGLDTRATEELLLSLTDQINNEMKNDENSKRLSPEQVAFGFIKVANESMARPIRTLTEARGYDTSKHRLATFGGAGGQHAVAIAEALGIKQILIHKYSSILSAYGMALADVVDEQQIPQSIIWSDDPKITAQLEGKFSELKLRSQSALNAQGFASSSIEYEEYLNMRYKGTESAMMVLRPERPAPQNQADNKRNYARVFVDQHEQEYGFTLPDREIIVDDLRVRGIGKSTQGRQKSVDDQLNEVMTKEANENAVFARRSVYFDGGRLQTKIYKLGLLKVGDTVKGPAILADGTQTIVVPPIATALLLETHVIINIDSKASKSKDRMPISADPILLSIFSHRFMAIAEQMGRALQKTSVSTNVKERLDFSCALFDAEGGLVANAPHLPVHLGSMSTCVQIQANLWKGKLKPGDVLVSNHPKYGGTHLPDITVITPSFSKNGIAFYVASRAHHADIGGILPGSMPPSSKELYQEGAAIKSEKLVSEGKFDEDRMRNLLYTEPAQYLGCSGTRCLADNINDLKAQISANQKGINLIKTLLEEYGDETVQFYMKCIQENAEKCVRNLLKEVCEQVNNSELSAEEYMDDGTIIKLKINIDAHLGEATFDFTGTGSEVYGNTNAPEAVTYSAIIYCLRSLIAEDIPLNQGCLKPIRVLIPKLSILSPSDDAAVVGGNVLTSQRVTDVVLKAFRACAASQGDTNNLTFGFGGNQPGSSEIRGFGYYETIAGGSGAGPTWNGSDGVHTHMTNTRITDPEILERRYPVLLREFNLRKKSGGLGQHVGGDGVVRDIEFRIPVEVSILSERRVHRPYGMAGGEDARCGINIWAKKVSSNDAKETAEQDGEAKKGEDYRYVNLGGKNTASMNPGDRIIIMTPGGGGWGKIGDTENLTSTRDAKATWKGGSLSAMQRTAEAST